MPYGGNIYVTSVVASIISHAFFFMWPYVEDPVGNIKEALRNSRTIRSIRWNELGTLSYLWEGNHPREKSSPYQSVV